MEKHSRNQAGMRFPDSCVAWAAKSGTTTLCAMLDEHPDIFITRPKEPMFFCRDEILVYQNYFHPSLERWWVFDWERRREELLLEYAGHYTSAAEHQLSGEGSPRYMASTKAPDRIAELKPEMKSVFILRDPVSRAYFHYWHLVSTTSQFNGGPNTPQRDG